jgi:nascent polypeptide-associated complex subunit alpha
MIPGMNQRQMQQMMKQMGIQQVELDAVRVIIETAEERLVFDNPQVSKVNMMGQQTYQIVGTPRKESIDTTPDINDDDIQTVMEQAGVSRAEAYKAITEAKGDLAEAIMKLKES